MYCLIVNIPLLRLDIGKVFQVLLEVVKIILESDSNCEAVHLVYYGLMGVKGFIWWWRKRRRNKFTVFRRFCLDAKNKPVFIVATANNISDLPPELLRKDVLMKYFVDLPTPQKEKIFSKFIYQNIVKQILQILNYLQRVKIL